MCIVIDMNTLASVFNEDSKNHEEFKPVKNWIINGPGKVVWGGTKYLEELKKTNSYLKLFNLLSSANKSVKLESSIVDAHADLASEKINHKDFDDPHIVGLLIASKCKLVCSEDKRSHPFLRHSLFFHPASDKPRIYCSKVNESLLHPRHIAEICKPCGRTTNAQKVILGLNNKLHGNE